MPRRNLEYQKLQGLEDERKLGYLEALSNVRTRTHWDSTSEIPGTGPEKEVYNYLVRLGVRFEFLYHMLDLPATAFPEDIWIPDFILPDYNSIIEVYGYYWHSIPKRREGDQLKKAYWLQSGYTVYEHGIPLYPSGGLSAGKAVIWWDYEIFQDLTHLFERDLPELFSPDRIQGQPEEFLLDFQEEKRRLAGQRAAMVAARLRPRLSPYEKQMRSLRKKLFDIEKTFPVLRELKEYAMPKISKSWKIK